MSALSGQVIKEMYLFFQIDPLDYEDKDVEQNVRYDENTCNNPIFERVIKFVFRVLHEQVVAEHEGRDRKHQVEANASEYGNPHFIVRKRVVLRACDYVWFPQ